MSALSSSVDNNQQPDGVRALKPGMRVKVLRGVGLDWFGVLHARLKPSRWVVLLDDGSLEFPVHEDNIVQSANAPKSQPAKTLEKSANNKEVVG